MNKLSLPPLSFLLVLPLGMGIGTAFAKGPGTNHGESQAGLEYHCASTAPSSAPAAKSPQWSSSMSCVPATQVRTTGQAGYTAAKTPSRWDRQVPID